MLLFSPLIKPLKVVNRKRPVRDDWNSFALQSKQEDEPLAVEDDDICIKVKLIQIISVLKQETELPL